MKGIQSYNDAKPPSTSPPRQRKPATPRVPKKKILSVHEVTPKPKRKRVKKKVAVAKKKPKLEDADSIEAKKATKTAGNGDESEDDRINRMKTENNDLYDLLYGDDNLMGDDSNVFGMPDDVNSDDLDDFDPYGLKER